MKRYKPFVTAGVALSIMGALAGCATAGNGTNKSTNLTSPIINTTTNATKNPSGPNSAPQNATLNSTGNNGSPSTTAVGKITAQTYNSSADAATAVTKLQQNFGQVHPSGPLVDLGTGIKAAFNGGAGQYRYQWHEGNWTINVLGFGDSDTGTQIAKKIVSYLHTHMLPAPKNKGTIIMTSSAAGSTWRTQVAWQEGATVYQLQQPGNPVGALETVVNSNTHAGTNGQSAGFHQTFRNYGGTNDMYLTPSIGFQVSNLGGGASNFEYQFSKTTDGGKTWTKLSTGHFSDVRGVSFINEQIGYLLNKSPAYAITPDLFVTHNGGVTWKEQKLPIPSAYKNYYRASNYPIFFSQQVGFIPVYGESMKQSSTTQFLYMLVTTDGGSSWTPYTNHQGDGLNWTLKGQKLTVTRGTQTITVNGLFGNWTVST